MKRTTPAALIRAHAAIGDVEQLELDILRAEHPPFEHWYRETWIRREPKLWNVHRPYEEMRTFLSTDGKQFLLPDTEPPHHPAKTPTTPDTR